MKRKIMKIADTTYVVSIPLKWIRSHNIEKGQEVDVTETDGGLKLAFDQAANRGNEARINLKSLNSISSRVVVSLYRLGYGDMNFKYDDAGISNRIQIGVNENTIGLAIVQQNNENTIVKDLSKQDETDIDSMKRRVWFLVLDMGEDIVNYLKKNDAHGLNTMPQREKSVNQFMNYCIRGLSKTNHSHSEYYLLRRLESIADDYRDFAVASANLKSKSKLADSVAKVNQLMREFNDCYFSWNLEKSDILVKHCESVLQDIEKELVKDPVFAKVHPHKDMRNN